MVTTYYLGFGGLRLPHARGAGFRAWDASFPCSLHGGPC